MRKSIAALLLAGWAVPALAQDLNQGLVAYWPFEGTVEDASPGNHDGTASGGPTYAAGRTGQALGLDGVDDAVSFASVPNSAFAGDFSIAWFMRVPANAKYAVLSKRASCNLSSAFDIRTTDEDPGRPRFSPVWSGGFADAFGSATAPGQWVHVVAVRQGNTARVYTDGVAGDDTAIGPMNLAGVTAPFGISVTPCIAFGDGTLRFAGQIDELRLYNRALSAAEAAELAGGTTLATETQLRQDLVAHYPFEINARDIAGGDLDGTTAGSPGATTGVLGGALNFDGVDDAVTFAAIPAATFAGDFSVAWWMRLPTLAPYALFGKRQTCSVSNHFDLRMRSSPANALGFELSRTGSNVYAYGTVPQDTWVHVTAVRQGGYARLYMDGRRGVDVALPTLDLGSVAAPFGLGISPCIAFGDGTRRLRGQIDDVRVYRRALGAAEIATLARPVTLSATPSPVSVGGELRVALGGLVPGRAYTLSFRGTDAGGALLRSEVATAPSVVWTVAFPSPGGDTVGRLILRSDHADGSVEEQSVPLTWIQSPLSLSIDTAVPQAGKPLTVSVSGLGEGSLRLRYADRVVYGPAPTDGSAVSVTFPAPADVPAGPVVVLAEQLQGRQVLHRAQQTITVASVFNGPFAEAQGLDVDDPLPRPGQKVGFDGHVVLRDGATPEDVEITAFWVSQAGRITALSTDALAVAPDGTFRLDTYPPSLGAMSAFIPQGPGRLRLVVRRTNAWGRVEHSITVGPLLQTDFPTRPPSSITVRVRRSGSLEPLSQAFVIIDGSAPLTPQQPGLNRGSTSSPWTLSLQALAGDKQPFRGIAPRLGQDFNLEAQHQYNESRLDFAFPEVQCDSSLWRRYTDAAGETVFQLIGGTEEQDFDWQLFGAGRYTADGCGDGGCTVARAEPYRFNLRVYTLHRGAGESLNINGNRYERPATYEVTYAPDGGGDFTGPTFSIRNTRTGLVSIQQGSALIELTAQDRPVSENYLLLGDPTMVQVVEGVERPVTRQGGENPTFGDWVAFFDSGFPRPEVFENPLPRKIIRFRHRPAVNGGIVSARLVMGSGNNGTDEIWGEFTRRNSVPGCNVQEDPGSAQTEEWELPFFGGLESIRFAFWRAPFGAILPADRSRMKVCGRIEAFGLNGAAGSRPVCMGWQLPPDGESLADFDATVRINDADMANVQVLVEGVSLGDAETELSEAPALFNEPADLPGEASNSGRSGKAERRVYGESGITGGTLRYEGENPRQYNEPAEGAAREVDAGAGSGVIPVGSPERKTILDLSIPLFQWYWGVPEILSAEVYARLRLLANYLYQGRIVDRRLEQLDAASLFLAMVIIGVDIDVLFGFIVDAGASLSGTLYSQINLPIRNFDVQPPQACAGFRLGFEGYVDPCVFCPTPVIDFSEPNWYDTSSPANCALEFDANARRSGFDLKGAIQPPAFGVAEMRALRRHPAIAFDGAGNGQVAFVAANGDLQVGEVGPGGFSANFATLSNAEGVRQSKIVYYTDGRALAVWFENSRPSSEIASISATGGAAALRQIAATQRIAWSEFRDGRWTAKQFLTSDSGGEAHPALVACGAGQPGCPPGGEVFFAWQRNEAGTVLPARNRIHWATWRPGSGWSTPTAVDPAAGNVQDVTPTAAYVGGKPFVLWVRQTGVEEEQFLTRNIAWRHIGVGTVRSNDSLPPVPLAPAIVAGPGGTGPEVLLSFVRPVNGEGPIGTANALHLAAGQCVGGDCTWAWRVANDPLGRLVYGERPIPVPTIGAEHAIVMRTFRFSDADGNPVYSDDVLQPGDPIGAVTSSGEILTLSADYATGIVRFVANTADAVVRWGPAPAYDPFRGEIVVLDSFFAPPAFGNAIAALRKVGPRGVEAMSRSKGMLGNLELRGLPAAPEFEIESASTGTTLLPPGGSITVDVVVGNRALAYEAATGAVVLRARLDSPAGPVVGSATLPSILGGGAADLALAVTLPADLAQDEAHVLHLELDVAASVGEISGSGNRSTIEFLGLPVPQALASRIRPGAPAVQLGWETPDDPRVAGYRVWRQAPDGQWMPLGASPVRGFLDISAQFLVPRTYAVSSYSARGVESARSEAVTVMPTLPEVDDVGIFSDGFEAPAGAAR